MELSCLDTVQALLALGNGYTPRDGWELGTSMKT